MVRNIATSCAFLAVFALAACAGDAGPEPFSSATREGSGLSGEMTASTRSAGWRNDRLATATPPPRVPDIGYNGGQTLRNATIIEVNWGPNIEPQLLETLPTFYSDLAPSPYLGLLSEYSCGAASFVGSYTITPSNQSTAIGAGDISIELLEQIQSYNLPGEGLQDLLYVVHFPAGITVSDQNGSTCGSPTGCSYHLGFNLPPTPFFWAAIPAVPSDQPTTGTFTGLGSLNMTTIIASHEIIEAMTDPEVGTGFYQDGAVTEIGDLCRLYTDVAGASGQHWLVTPPYLNSVSGCAPQTPPVVSVSTSGSGVVKFAGTKGLGVDVFAIDSSGFAFVDEAAPLWTATRPVYSAAAPPFAPMAGTARSATHREAFYPDSNGMLHLDTWAGGPWKDTPLGWAAASVPGARLSSISRGVTGIDLFYVDVIGSLRWGWLDPVGWSNQVVTTTGSLNARGEGVAAIAPMPNLIDLFWVARDGLYTAQNVGYGAPWSAPTQVSNKVTASLGGGNVAAVARTFQAETLFFATDSQQLAIASRGSLNGSWSLSTQGSSGQVPRTAQLAAVTCDVTSAQAFFVASDSNVYDAAVSGSNLAITNVTTGSNVAPGSWVGAVLAGGGVIELYFFDSNQRLVQATGSCGLKSTWTTSIIGQVLPRPACNTSSSYCTEAVVTCAPVATSLSFQIKRSNGTFGELATQAPYVAAYFTDLGADGATNVYRVCNAGSTFCSPEMPVALQACAPPPPPPPPPPHCPRGKIYCGGMGCVRPTACM